MKVCKCENVRLDCCKDQKYEIKVRVWKERQRIGKLNQIILDERVDELEQKMRRVIDKSAPMRTTIKKANTPSWINRELEMILARQAEAQNRIRKATCMEERRYAYRVRNKASAGHKNIKKTCAMAKLNHKLDAKPWDHWGATKEFLGIDNNKSPKELIQVQRIEVQKGIWEDKEIQLRTDKEIADGMNEQYRRKEEEVAKAIGNETGDYLT